MKKLIALILLLTFVLALVGCDKSTGGGEPVAGGADMPNIENNSTIETDQSFQFGELFRLYKSCHWNFGNLWLYQAAKKTQKNETRMSIV